MAKTFECPQCGADVVVGRASCPECGSDDRTGWQSSEDIDHASVDLPDGYATRETDERGPMLSPRVVFVVALVTTIAFVLAAVL
jgi:hypothetical protein